MSSAHRLLLDTGPNPHLPQPPPSNGNKPRGGAYTSEANFDTNMVIILAALLCALICALGLNSIVRCALRCGRRIAFETPAETAARLAGTGLKKRALRQIPVAVYGSGVEIPATECPICLGEFAEGEKVRVLPKCNHGFHMRCIDTWLASHSSCPTCRHSLLDRPAAADAGEDNAAGPSPGHGSGSGTGGVIIAVDEVMSLPKVVVSVRVNLRCRLSADVQDGGGFSNFYLTLKVFKFRVIVRWVLNVIQCSLMSVIVTTTLWIVAHYFVIVHLELLIFQFVTLLHF